MIEAADALVRAMPLISRVKYRVSETKPRRASRASSARVARLPVAAAAAR